MFTIDFYVYLIYYTYIVTIVNIKVIKKGSKKMISEKKELLDELLLSDKMEKMYFLLSTIVEDYNSPGGMIDPYKILAWEKGERSDELNQQVKIAFEYGRIINIADIARDYCANILDMIKNIK